jgi:indolepyruvate ferredoxin oxidoreductase beta subunit
MDLSTRYYSQGRLHGPMLAWHPGGARWMEGAYADTHDAGEGKFSRLMAMADRLGGRADAAEWMRRLRTAALADAEGRALDDTIKTIESFL